MLIGIAIFLMAFILFIRLGNQFWLAIFFSGLISLLISLIISIIKWKKLM